MAKARPDCLLQLLYFCLSASMFVTRDSWLGIIDIVEVVRELGTCIRPVAGCCCEHKIGILREIYRASSWMSPVGYGRCGRSSSCQSNLHEDIL